MKNLQQIAFCIAFIGFSLSSFSQTVFRGAVFDQATNQPISNAKVGITSQGVGEITDKAGKFVYRKYNEILSNESELIVTAEGYKKLTNGYNDIQKLINQRGVIYLSKEEKLASIETDNLGKLQVFWDASKIYGYRDIEKEFRYLKGFIKDRNIKEINFTAFNNSIVISEFLNTPGTFESDLYQIISKINYEGIADYGLLFIEDVAEVVLVAANKSQLGTFNVNQDIPVNVIRTNKNEKYFDYFIAICAYTSGVYYTAINEEKSTTETLDLVDSETAFAGIVTSQGNPLQNAEIMRKGTLEVYVTDKNGRFKVKALPGDTFEIKHLGMYPKSVEFNNEKEVTIALIPKTEVLAEVELKEKIEKPLPAYDHYIEESHIEVVNGRKHLVREVLFKEDLNKAGFDIYETVANSSLRIGVTEDGTGYKSFHYKKGFSNSGLSVVVDGIGKPMAYVNPLLVERVSVDLLSGIIIITTRKNPALREQFYDENAIEVLDTEYKETLPVFGQSKNHYFLEREIRGKISVKNTPLQGVSVIAMGTLNEVFTDALGEFTINAAAGDILQIKHLGMYPKTVVVSEDENYNIALTTKSEMLDEVALTEKITTEVVTEYDNYDAERGIEVVNGIKYNVRQVLFKKDLYKAGFDIYETILNSNSRLIRKRDNFVYKRGGGGLPGLNEIILKTIVDGKEVPAYFVSPILVERVSIYLQRGEGNSKLFITTRNHPDKQKQYLAENGIKVLDQEYEEEVATLNANNNQYVLEKEVTGIISVKNTVLQGVSIKKLGSLQEVFTDVTGAFKIDVAEGDILEIKHLGMYPKSVLITEEDTYTIELAAKAELLDEVALSEKKEKEKELIKTATGERDKNAVGVQIEKGISDYISIGDIDFIQVANKIPGVVVDPGTGAIFYTRSFGAIDKSPIMIIVDGTPVSQNTLKNINPQDITDIKTLKGVAATNIYGSQAFGGAMLITTFAGSNNDRNTKTKSWRV